MKNKFISFVPSYRSHTNTQPNRDSTNHIKYQAAQEMKKSEKKTNEK